MFGVKDFIPSGLRLCSRVVYKFSCAGCNACYVPETTWHFSIRVGEYLTTHRASPVFKHLQDSKKCHS